MLPGATNPSENGLSVLPEALQARQQRVAQLVGAAVALIGHFFLDHVPGMLAAVAFRTVGRQRHDAHPLREPWVAVAQMEPGVVADDDTHCLSIARSEFFEMQRVAAEVHRGQMGKVRLSPAALLLHTLWNP